MQTIADGRPVEHLGDGVYAVHDGQGIELRANDHEVPTDVVYIDGSVLVALLRFDGAVRAAVEQGKTFLEV